MFCNKSFAPFFVASLSQLALRITPTFLLKWTYPHTILFSQHAFANANFLTTIFSPIEEICNFKNSSKLVPSIFDAFNSSIFFISLLNTCSVTFLVNATKFSFLATKSVCEFTSVRAALVLFSSSTKVIKPSAATLLAFLAALAKPFSLKNSIAFSISPQTSCNAFLHSIIPAPVASLKSFTNFAVISIKSSYY